jgi:hypothetical protein
MSSTVSLAGQAAFVLRSVLLGPREQDQLALQRRPLVHSLLGGGDNARRSGGGGAALLSVAKKIGHNPRQEGVAFIGSIV